MEIVYGMAYAPSNPSIVYLVTDATRVWKSTNGGATWQSKKRGLRQEGFSSVIVHPSNENVAFVPSYAWVGGVRFSGFDEGIYRTTDGGESWAKVKASTISIGYSTMGAVSMAFSQSDMLFAATDDEGVIRTIDNGTTWTQLPGAAALVGKRVVDMRIHPGDPNTLFLSTADPNYRFVRLTDIRSTATVTSLGNLPTYPTNIQINARDSSIIYASLREYGVYKSTNGGAAFSPINNGLDPSAVFKAKGLALSPVDPNYLFVDMSLSKFRYSHNGGLTWQDPVSMDEENAEGWVAGSLDASNMESRGSGHGAAVIAHPRDRQVALMLGTSFKYHVKKTTDGGVNWRYSNTGITGGNAHGAAYATDKSCINFDLTNPKRFLLSLVDTGNYLTEDEGDTFRPLGGVFVGPPVNGYSSTNAAAIDPTPNSQVIVTAFGGQEGDQRLAITRNANSPRPSWNIIGDQPGEPETMGNYKFIAFNPQNPNIVHAHSWRSTDKGVNWARIQYRVGAMRPENGSVVYAFEPNSSSSTKVFRSTDSGTNWTDLTTAGLPYALIPVAKGDIGQIAIDPSRQDRFYAAVVGGLYIITGSTLVLKDQRNGLAAVPWAGPGSPYFAKPASYLVAVDPNRHNVIYVGALMKATGLANGIYRSVDGGDNFVNITYQLGPEFTPRSIRVNPHNGYVYMGSLLGTFRLPPPY